MVSGILFGEMTPPEFLYPERSPESGDIMKCLFCGGGDLIRNVKVLDREHGHENPVKLGKDRNPAALLFKGRERSTTNAIVCGRCGFVHLFACSPGALKQVGG